MSTKLGDAGPALRALFGAMLSGPDGFTLAAMNEAVREAGTEVQEKAIELAPFRTGALESSSSLEITGSRAEITFDVDYAAEVHELPETAVGPGTQDKPGNELGPAGPKFLERPMIAMQDKLGDFAVAALTRHIEEEVG